MNLSQLNKLKLKWESSLLTFQLKNKNYKITKDRVAKLYKIFEVLLLTYFFIIVL